MRYWYWVLIYDSMKLDKTIVQRRLDLMEAEGIVCHHHPCDLLSR